jgi:DNA-binding GntR family transcriptional regulator
LVDIVETGGILEKLDTTPLHERVYQRLRRAIMAGLYPPGQSFNFSQVAKELGTSIMPVREALSRLEAEQAVEIMPKRGVTIPVMTPEKYAELGRIRLKLEGMAAEMAAQAISDATLDLLSSIVRDMAIMHQQAHRWQDYVLMNYEFHFAVYRAGTPQVLLPLIESLWLQSGPLLNIYKDVGIMENSRRHDNIVDALARKDADGARRAVQTDLIAGFHYISKAHGWSIDFKLDPP